MNDLYGLACLIMTEIHKQNRHEFQSIITVLDMFRVHYITKDNFNVKRYYDICDDTTKMLLECLYPDIDEIGFSTGGQKRSTNSSYIQYNNRTYKVCVSDKKKYITVKKEPVYLKDIKGKYRYTSR